MQVFSKRLVWNSGANALSLLLSRKRDSGTRIFDLTESNPTRAGFVYPQAEILDAFRDERMLAYDPASAGLSVAREAVAEFEKVNAGRVVLTSSTSEAYSWLFKLLCNPGDRVLVPRPSYPLFEYLAALEFVEIAPYPLVYHGSWSLDLPALEHSIHDRTRAIVVVNPNNPTGSYIEEEELQALTRICRRHGLALISDEVFRDYELNAPPDAVRTLAGVSEVPTFCLNGLSKTMGMPQMKLGWMVTNSAAAHEQLELIADTYLSVGTPVQYALPSLLALRPSIQGQILARLHRNLARLREQLSPRFVEGGWSAVVQVPCTRTEEQWAAQLLDHQNVLVQPGYFYDFEHSTVLVLSLLTEPDIFDEGADRIARVLYS